MDESQEAVGRKHVKDAKTFPDKESAKAWKAEREAKTGKRYSEVSEVGEGKYFVCYCEPGELLVDAIRASAEYYGLTVPLDGEYIVGPNWKTCH